MVKKWTNTSWWKLHFFTSENWVEVIKSLAWGSQSHKLIALTTYFTHIKIAFWNRIWFFLEILYRVSKNRLSNFGTFQLTEYLMFQKNSFTVEKTGLLPFECHRPTVFVIYEENLGKYEWDKNYRSKSHISTVGNSLKICWNLLSFWN